MSWINPVAASVAGFGISLVLFGQFLDRILSENARDRLSYFLLTGQLSETAVVEGIEGAPWQHAASKLSEYFVAAFHVRHFLRFLPISISISLMIITMAFSYFYFSSSQDVQGDLLSILADNKLFWLALVVPLIATLLIDLIAAYQTILFVEMVGKSRAFWQVIVLFYGNVLLAVVLFSVTFPLVAVGLLIFENQLSHSGKLQFSPVATRQDESGRNFTLLLTVGPDVYKDIESTKFIVWRIDTTAIDRDNRAKMSHSMSFVSSAELSPADVNQFIAGRFKDLNEDFPVAVRDIKHTPQMFGLPSFEIEIEVRKVYSELPLASLYRIAFNDVNLFGQRSLDIAQGKLLSVDSDSMMPDLANELRFRAIREGAADFFLLCDGAVERSTKVQINSEKISRCDKWAAVSTGLLKQEVAMLTSQVTSKIYIAPFAISSLSMTLVVYVFGFVLLYAAVIRRLIPEFFQRDWIDVRQYPLTACTGAAFTSLILPISAIIQIISF